MNLRAARRPAIAIATAATLTLGAAACSKDQAANTPASSSAAANSTGSNAAPADGEKITASKSGVTFLAPKGWKLVDITKVANTPESQLPEEFKKFAETQGKTPAELLQAMGRADVMVMSDQAGAFSDNINVIPATGATSLPSEDELKSQFETTGATVTKVEKVKVDGGGEAIVSNYTLPVGSQTVQGRSVVYLHSADHAAVLTISMADSAKADEVLKKMLGSLTAA